MNRPKFSEATILSVAKTTLANARSTATALAEFGVTDESLNAFESNIQQAEALPGETQERIELRDLTTDKDEALDACYQWGRKLRVRLQLAFGRTSAQAQSFPSKEFNAAVSSENTMMSVMEVLIALADKHNAELTDYGQSAEILAQGSQLLAALRAADAVQEVRKDAKRQATLTRYELFLQLYDTIVRISKIGRLVFENDPVHLALFESKWPTASTAAASPTGASELQA